MHFKFSCEVAGLRDHLKGVAGAEFRFSSPMAAVVQVSKQHSDGQALTEPANVVCGGTTTGEIEDEVCAAEIRSAMSRTLDGKWANFGGMDPNRSFLRDGAMDQFFEPLRVLMESTVNILRWRSGLAEGPNNPFRNRREFLSNDGNTWLEVGTLRSFYFVQIPSPRQLATTEQFDNDVMELVSNGTEEPLGHQLFREAWNQRSLHPRSALVIGVAAAEVGLKKLVGALVPKAQWLMDEVQTPAFIKMIRNYLPLLPIKGKLKGKKLTPPSKLIRSLQVALESRNKVAHAGGAAPCRDELEGMLRAVDDFLWICDLYAGHLWAARYISSETHIAWENEEGPQSPV